MPQELFRQKVQKDAGRDLRLGSENEGIFAAAVK